MSSGIQRKKAENQTLESDFRLSTKDNLGKKKNGISEIILSQLKTILSKLQYQLKVFFLNLMTLSSLILHSAS